MSTATNSLILGGEGLAEPVERKFKPVMFFAAIGALFLALEVYIYIDWIFFSGKFKRTPQGPTPIPEWMRQGALWVTIVTAAGFLAAIYFFVIKPLRRDGRLSTDGLLAISFILIYWQDPLLNYTVTVSTYNTVFPNWGSWTQSVPGWLSPRGSQMAEPLIWSGPTYLAACFTACVAANWLMRKFKARHPQTGTLGMIGICVAGFMVVDFVAESFWMRLGTYTYAGTIPWLTMFRGHYYQFPTYEILLGGITWGAWACLRYFRNDKGQTVVERGIEEIRGTQRQKTFVRFLALLAGVNLSMLLLYNLPHQWFAMHAGPWPKDITSRSYLTDGFCGPDTTWACNSPTVPIPRVDAPHLSPQGTLVAPDTKNTPIFVPSAKP